MTHGYEKGDKAAELNELFSNLDEKGKDSALTVLKALDFAQSVMCEKKTARGEHREGGKK